ncbi:linear amide C-N hydrolase [Weissella viridescens]|uniref:Linear amide C-N hydrolase n=1 Tax=Weissella viridescens TaxID=1629 RepID=A0A3P2RA54_WEIVI|nr:linear amide C-N hydrolase [Weissella viridescens]RRG17667.1 linear amide C-N hydrolase [Weissella viridescens]
MCTGIRLTATGGEVFWGRTMDLAAGMFGEEPTAPAPSSFVTYPRDVEVHSSGDNWTTKYAAVGMAPTNTSIMYDGINEKGLAGDIQVLMECTHAPADEIKKRGQKPVIAEEFVTYVLTQFASVQEIRDNYQKLALSDQPEVIGTFKVKLPAHYIFVDETGDGIVLEPVEAGSFKLYEYSGVATNSPEYSWHQTNLNNYIGLDTNDVTQPKQLKGANHVNLTPIENGTGYGFFGLPGDYTSVSRFVRASLISNNLDAFEAKDGINILYAAFRSVIIPRGLEHADPQNAITDASRYWVGYDLANRTAYAQPITGLAISSMGIDPDVTEITFTELDTSVHAHTLHAI